MTFIQVTTAVDSEDGAKHIADALVRDKVAACVQIIGPVSSTYRWEERVETATEWLCLIKSTEALFEDLEVAIREIHPYDVPEIIGTPIVAGSADYLRWISSSLERST